MLFVVGSCRATFSLLPVHAKLFVRTVNEELLGNMFADGGIRVVPQTICRALDEGVVVSPETNGAHSCGAKSVRAI